MTTGISLAGNNRAGEPSGVSRRVITRRLRRLGSPQLLFEILRRDAVADVGLHLERRREVGLGLHRLAELVVGVPAIAMIGGDVRLKLDCPAKVARRLLMLAHLAVDGAAV